MNFARYIINFSAWHTCLKCTGLLAMVLLLANCNHPAGKKEPHRSPKDEAFLSFENRMKRLFKEGKFDSIITEGKRELPGAKQANAKSHVAYLYANIGNGYLGLRRQDSAINYYRACEVYAAASNALELKIVTQITLSGAYYDAGKPDSVNIYKNKMMNYKK